MAVDQKAFDTLHKAYQATAYAKPCDHAKCFALAEQLLELAKGTRLESVQAMVVERHRKRM